MKLILKEFTCNHATDDGAGGDSPYFVVFIGKPKTAPMGPVHLSDVDFQIATVWKAKWDDVIDDGITRKPNLVVSNFETGKSLDVGGNSCVLIALCEQDDSVDITHDERHDILVQLLPDWLGFGGGVQTSSGTVIAKKLQPKFYAAVDDAQGNDELLGVRRLTPTSGFHHLNFAQDEWDYDVTFELS